MPLKFMSDYKICIFFSLDQLKNNPTDSENYNDSSVDEDEYISTDEAYFVADDSCFSFLNSIHSTSEFGKINDCQIVESKPKSEHQTNSPSTIAVCTSEGYINIYNIQTNVELFSIRLTVPSSNGTVSSKLSKLYYSTDYIIAIGSQGYVYFIDLKQANPNTETSTGTMSYTNSSNSSFLSHTIKLTSNQLQSLCIYKERIVCIGDSMGNIYFLSLINF